MIATVEDEVGQTPLPIVHWNTFTPTPNALTELFSNVGVAIVPAPETKLQVPVPTEGIFPANKVEVKQTDIDAPALDTVGFWSRCILTVDDTFGQTPFPIVHWKIFDPTPKPVTPLLFTSGDVTDDGPLNTLHVPVPIAGITPFKFAVVAHTV